MKQMLMIKPLKHHHEEIQRSIKGIWEKDKWAINEIPFTVEWNQRIKTISFEGIRNVNVKNEIKFFYVSMMKNQIWKPSLIWGGSYRSAHGKLISFLDRFYSDINSIIDVSREVFLMHYRTFLTEWGVPITRTRKDDLKDTDSIIPTPYINLYNSLYNFYVNFYDNRNELDKDIWKAENSDINYVLSHEGNILNFGLINSHNFRELLKKYIKLKLIDTRQIEFSTAKQYVRDIAVFCNYYSNKYSKDDFNSLTRDNVEGFLSFLKNHLQKTQGSIDKTLSHTKIFLEDLERYNWRAATAISVSKLIYTEDYYRKKPFKSESVKFIPDVIWEQLLQHIEKLPSDLVPLIIILEATGLRISDALELDFGCLIHNESGWWVRTDIKKVKKKHHLIPITDEVASVMLSQIEIVKRNSTTANNPYNLIFTRFCGKRKGLPYSQRVMTDWLNRIAKRYSISDQNGEIYKFNLHAFRHRYGVNLINNGMNILHVQKLMAHASPEMTLVYARILDTTLRKEWEIAREKGAVRLDPSGKVINANFEQQAEENGLEIEWIRHNIDSIRLDHGFCIKSPKLNCEFLNHSLEQPCIKNNCRSFHVDNTFLPYYQEQIAKMESDIKIYKETGRGRSIELIEPKLKRYREISDGILSKGGVFGIPKARREYREEEWEKVRSNG